MRSFLAALQRYTSLALLGLPVALLDACSGAVSGPPPTPAPNAPLAITPSTATVYSNLPSTFVITGGNGNYIVNSSNQAIVPSILSLTSSGFTIVPNDVAADTPVTLTVQDTAGDTPVSAALTVKPRTISNVVTITPSASQSAACGTAICAGGDAVVTVVLSQAGVPLVDRQVKFDVVSGDFAIITSAPGTPETTALSATAVTDTTGAATIRIRVSSTAGAETGLLQITDVSSGFTQRTGISIAPSSNAPLNAQPSTIVFQGMKAGTCADSISADVIVFGGRPPYLISQPGSFTVSPLVVTSNGGRFTVTAIGQCTSGSQIAVVDQNGATVSVNASNKLSDLPVVPPTPTTTPVAVSSTSTTISSCNQIANITISGGTGTYFATSSDSRVDANVTQNVGSIGLRYVISTPTPTYTPMPSSADVTFSDGKTTAMVKVTISVPGGQCP